MRLVRQTALLTLVGPGGVGKTRLALHVAGEVADAFADGVVFVPLAALGDPAMVGPTIAMALDLPKWDAQSPLAMLSAALQSRHLLLVLDNFERVAEAALLVADLLAACPRLTVLVTSRVPLHLTGEQEFSVPPLAIPTAAQAEAPQVRTLQDVPAVALFVARARLVAPDFALAAENAGAIAAICRRLDGLPLALELAAARIKILSPQALLGLLEQRLPVLTGGPRDAPARQQTLRDTIAWSHDLLSTAEQALFARLGVFVGGCSLAAVAAICGSGGHGETLEGLASLVDKSLLQSDRASGHEDAPRYVMLETVHEFAREQLAARPEAADICRGHARYFTALAEEATHHRYESVGLEWRLQMDRDGENVRAALDWCAAQAETGDGEALDLTQRLGLAVWHAAAYWGFGDGAWVRHELLTLLSRAHATASPQARAQVLDGAGVLAETAGLVTQANALYSEALTLARASGHLALAVWPLVHLAMGRSDPAHRRADLEEALALASGTVTDQRAADAFSLWGVQIYLAVHHLDVGDLTQSRALAELVHAQSVAQGNLYIANAALDVLAHVARAEGETAAARQLFAESLTLRRLHGDGGGIGHILRFLGEIAEEQGETEQARTSYAEALVLLRDAWDVNRIAAVLRGVAALALADGDARWALRLAGAVSAHHARCGTRIYMDVAPAQKLWARTSWEQIGETARHALGPADATVAWAEGQAMALEQAIAEALDYPACPVS
jgi:predicted ATPase